MPTCGANAGAPSWNLSQRPAAHSRLGKRAGMAFPIYPHMLRHACGYALALPERLDVAQEHPTVRYTPSAPKGIWRQRRLAVGWSIDRQGIRILFDHESKRSKQFELSGPRRARVSLDTIAQSYRLRLKPGFPVEPQSLITLRPRYGLRMTLERRTDVKAAA